jgi:fibro-slime domain-containing protein
MVDRRFLGLTAVLSAAWLGFIACSPTPDADEQATRGLVGGGGNGRALADPGPEPALIGANDPGDQGDTNLLIAEDSANGASVAGSSVEIFNTLPNGFSPADEQDPAISKGGFHVLGPLAEVATPEGECGNILRVIVRDFQATHDDFENAHDWSSYEVLSPIGASRKPQKVSENGPDHFEEWYENIEGTNLPFAVDLWLEPVADTFVFDSTAFFPLQDQGYNDNYSFTTELHTNFEYKGGEVFTFRGDDDVFVFVNGYEAVNLSGVHTAQEGSVSLDEVAQEFGLELGGAYTFDLFQAERQPSGSNFRLETTLDFTGCGEILPIDAVIK